MEFSINTARSKVQKVKVNKKHRRFLERSNEEDQTGSNRENPGKKCTVSSSDRIYKPSRYYNRHHNRSPISAQHFDSTPQPRSNTSRCRDGSCTPSFVSIYDILSLFVRMLSNTFSYHNRSPIFAHLFRRITSNDEIHMFKMQQSVWKKVPYAKT